MRQLTPHRPLRRQTTPPAGRHEPAGAAPRPGPAETLADRLVSELVAAGITTFFGVPGGAIEPLFNALARAQARGQVEVVPMRSEAGAAFAADGYFRASGRLPACTATTGPGIANLITATMSAHADRVPLLLLTPQVAVSKQGRGALQDSSLDGYDLTRVLGCCTRYSTEVTSAAQLEPKLARALAAADAAPSGPVHLSLPSDVLGGPPPPPRATPLRAPRPRLADGAAVEALTDAVLGARPVLFYVGDDAGPEVQALGPLARALGAQVVTSPAGKRWLGGRLDDVHRGVLGFSGHVEARAAVERAELIVAFGATFDELSTNAWTALGEAPVFSVDRHLEHVHRVAGLRPVVAETADVVRSLSARVPVVEESAPLPTPGPGPGRALGAGPVHPSELMGWLSEALPAEVAVHVDAGNSFSWSTRDLIRPLPDTYRVAMGLSSMAWAISSVVGASVASGRRTLCVCGDGSMLMSGLELTVAVERDLPVTYVVLNDSSLGMVRHGQRLSGAEPIAHEIAPVRFDALARSVGARAVRIEHGAELETVPRDWLAAGDGGPALIDVRIDADAVPPMADRVRGLAVGVPK